MEPEAEEQKPSDANEEHGTNHGEQVFVDGAGDSGKPRGMGSAANRSWRPLVWSIAPRRRRWFRP